MDDMLPMGSELNQATHKFAFIVDGDVFGVISLDENNPNDTQGVEKRCIAGLSSDPKVVLLPANSPAQYGWKWDGTNFHPSEELAARAAAEGFTWDGNTFNRTVE